MKMNWMDNAVTRALSKLFDLLCLNVLWIVCSIPIVTIGASTTAMYSVMLKFVKNEEGYIAKGFFRAWKENFKQSTIVWLLLIILGGIWYVDFVFANAIGGAVGSALKTLLILCGFLLLSVAAYAFPLIARYENSLKVTLKNAMLLAIGKLPYTLLMVGLFITVLCFTFWDISTMMIAFPFWLMLGVSGICWINSWLLRKVFLVFESD